MLVIIPDKTFYTNNNFLLLFFAMNIVSTSFLQSHFPYLLKQLLEYSFQERNVKDIKKSPLKNFLLKQVALRLLISQIVVQCCAIELKTIICVSLCYGYNLLCLLV